MRVFERSATLREVGTGIKISANAGHALDALGVGGEARGLGIQPETRRTQMFDTGDIVAELDIGRSTSRSMASLT